MNIETLEGYPKKCLILKKNGELLVKAYTDVDQVGSIKDRRSTIGYYMFIGGNFVTWRSKKQNVVARSSVEAEHKAMTLGICEV